MSLEDALARRNERICALGEEFSKIAEGRDVSAITLEIGCGKGHYLSSYAAANPSEFCIGLDLISERVRDARRRASNKHAQNAFFMKAEACEFLAALPENVRLAKVFIFFPDPWPKERHHKRRLMQPAFLDTLRQFSTPDTVLYFRTDYREYFDWTVEAINSNSNWRILPDNTLPFEEVSQFQRILPDFSTLAARAK